jgi:uncharacterized protein with HEPN domain
MQLESRKLLFDVRRAADLLTRFTADKALADYVGDVMLRSAVERQFEIIGEALAQLTKRDPELAERISQRRRIIDFRNVIIHGYSEVDDKLVWDVRQSNLPTLRREIKGLLDVAEG